MSTLATIAAVLLALGGPPLLAIISMRCLDDSSSLMARLPFDLVLWGLLAVILAIVVRAERQPLASIGLRRPR